VPLKRGRMLGQPDCGLPAGLIRVPSLGLSTFCVESLLLGQPNLITVLCNAQSRHSNFIQIMSAQQRNQFFDFYSEMEEDNWDSLSWDGIRDENGEDDGDDDSEHTDEDVSEGESNIQTLSDEDPTAEDRAFIVPDTYEPSDEDSDSENDSEDADDEPTAEDRAFIVPDTYESSGEDDDSDDEIDEESTHVGHIEGDGTFVPLAGYEDLILKPSLKLRILRKHTIERSARLLGLRHSEKALGVPYP
jgi:hypothetical protein